MTEIGILSVALTQKCNLTCRHCLRGEARNSVIKDETIYKIFSQINKLNMLLLTGGEVFLHPEKIITVSEAIIKNQTKIKRISIVANGTIWNEKTKEALRCLKSVSQPDVAISSDLFHKEELKRLKLHDFSNEIVEFCKENKIEYTFSDLRKNTLVMRGRAKTLNESNIPHPENQPKKKYKLLYAPPYSKEKSMKALTHPLDFFRYAEVNIDGAVGGSGEEWEYYDNPDNILFNVNDMTFEEYIKSQEQS